MKIFFLMQQVSLFGQSVAGSICVSRLDDEGNLNREFAIDLLDLGLNAIMYQSWFLLMLYTRIQFVICFLGNGS